MALFKEILQEDGVTTNYHRILCLQTTVNCQNSISVLSYVNDDSREKEKTATIAQPYQKAVTYEIPYDETMTIEKAYEHLKTMPEFEGATNI